MPPVPDRPRSLVVVLGDQLDPASAAFRDFDPSEDAVWMAEAAEEAEFVWSHKARIALFLSAMRHFRDECAERGWPVLYHDLEAAGTAASLAEQLEKSVAEKRPQRVVLVEPGEWRLRERLKAVVRNTGAELDMRPDTHFLCTHDAFAEHAEGRRTLRMEYFYRQMRREYEVLVTVDGKPVGGEWNYDSENRERFGSAGPPECPPPARFDPDETTRKVLAMVARRFSDHPGSLDTFAWPVTSSCAAEAVDRFFGTRLARFGPFQDAMWTGRPFLFHSLLSSSLNLKLLEPESLLRRAEQAYENGVAPLNSVEGFVRQILGWREYVRAIYWNDMPDYADGNALDADAPLPAFYWTADTECACLRDALEQVLTYGYGHHIQRLMITGLYALLLGVEPAQVHRWYLAMYVDAVEWVEMPNVLGMSQFADGGRMASKPYAASGKYIDRMSNSCSTCPYDPEKRSGDEACPFTVLYWDFLARNRTTLGRIPRMGLQLKNLDRLSEDRLKAIRRQADRLRDA